MKYMPSIGEAGVNLQKMYDDLGVYIESLQAQRAAIGSNPNICTHPVSLQEKTDFSEGRSITHCKHCRRVISATGFDCVSEDLQGGGSSAKASVIPNLHLLPGNGLSRRSN